MANSSSEPKDFVWKATARQARFLSCPYFEVLFGGARGGGKTDAVLGEFLSHQAQYSKSAVGLVLRRERTQLIETIQRGAALYKQVAAKWLDKDKCFEFPSGARLYFGYLERDQDADVYQGWNLTRIYVEELGNFRAFAPIAKLFATLRSPAGVPCLFRATANPGGAGHGWIRQRYIDPFPAGNKRIVEKLINPITKAEIIRDRAYVPSRVTDNPYLGNEYVANLIMSGAGSEALVRAWLEGDWSAIEGAFFSEWSASKHVVAPFAIPSWWTKYRAIDWGTARPFSIGWYAVVSEPYALNDGTGRVMPRGAIVRYREWYGIRVDGSGAFTPNEGVKRNAADVAQEVVARSTGEEISYTVIDPSVFANTGGQTIGEAFMSHGVPCLAADNTRVANRGAMSGWNNVRRRLTGDDGVPTFYAFSTNTHLIRTLPVIQHDKNRAEDLDCWVAGTMISTPSGDKAIETIVAGDMVDTPIGPRRVLKSYLSGAGATVRVTLSNGAVLQGTGKHRIYVRSKGLVALHDLNLYDLLKSKVDERQETDNRVILAAASLVKALPENLREFIVAIFMKQNATDRLYVTRIEYCDEPATVYNLTVVHAHLFYANGILSSNTDAEDHCVDELRYALASRPWAGQAPVKPEPIRDIRHMSVDELFAMR